MIKNRISSRVLFGSATALLMGATLFAQVTPGGGQQPGQPAPGQQPQQPTSPTAGYPGTNPGNAPTAQNFGDQAFLGKAMAGGKAEVALGQMAEQKSQSNDVKQFAQKMVSDHSQMGDKWFKPVAKQLGVAEPKGPSKKDKKEIEKLQGLSGPDFDTEYIKFMVKDHQQDLKDFESEAQSAQDPNVKQIAQQGSKVISQHLQLAELLAKNHNVEVASNSK
jgi:putative membrane protein